MNTSQIISDLVAHYGSTQAVNKAAAEVWPDEVNPCNSRMLKIDALYELHRRLELDGRKTGQANQERGELSCK